MGPYLGIDFGTKRIGLAISDPDLRVAVAKELIENNKEAIARICAIVNNEAVKKIVVGLPLSAKGQPTDMTSAASAFAEKLEVACTVPVILHDERLTTSGIGATAKETVGRDQASAQLLLQSFIERERS